MKKQKKLITLTDNQINFIEKISKNRQISFSEALRRVLDDYINNVKQDIKEGIS
jgi:uncharacterized membrane-anchored protein YjiN (DUF445 family)